MANSSRFEILSSEVDSRLDELFREDDPPPPSTRPGTVTNHPLTELKKTVLSIDWEITPDALELFQKQIRLLKEAYPHDKAAMTLLQILGHLGQYITSSRSKVHPGTFAVLNSVFARLDQVLSNPNMAKGSKQQLLQAAMNTYQGLRDKIGQRRAVKSPAKIPVATGGVKTQALSMVTPEMLHRAVQELKEFIRSEIRAMRDQLKIGSHRS